MAKNTFRGGVFPMKKIKNAHEGKGPTREQPTRAYSPARVVIPVQLHLGAPSEPCVKAGERVRLGQVVATPMGGLGLPVHASVSGTVTAIEDRIQFGGLPVRCIVIENDGLDEWVELTPLGDVETVPAESIIPAIRDAGICGMGGATFPTHAKLTIPEGKHCDTVIVNGAECETHLTSDFRLMLEQPLRIVDGLRAVMRALGVERGVIAVEDNKPEAVAALMACAEGRAGVSVVVMPTKYPQGSEKQLIKAVTDREVPAFKLPIDVHTVVVNVATAAAIADAVTLGKPLVERITTVTGCVREPGNLLLRIGTLFQDAINACGGYSQQPGKIIAGGAMTGICAPDDQVSVGKGSGGILVMNVREAKTDQEQPCIRCARCAEVCPIGLDPFLIKYYCDHEDYDGAEEHHVMECMMCGCCAYICPSRRWLTTSFRTARQVISARRREEK
ncbi:MAG: electron transport complex subunit RsxC [Clostridia bacterium]|nr:electron transport complex subunit RsxC [Clostridia bacterium]